MLCNRSGDNPIRPDPNRTISGVRGDATAPGSDPNEPFPAPGTSGLDGRGDRPNDDTERGRVNGRVGVDGRSFGGFFRRTPVFKCMYEQLCVSSFHTSTQSPGQRKQQ